MSTIQPKAPAGPDAMPPAPSSDFSVVSGGLVYRFWRRTKLSGDALEFARRRVLAMVLITWVPLLLLTIAEGNAWGGSAAVPFLKDIETHLRQLVAAPLLILAELQVHRVLPVIVRQFVDRNLIPDAARPQFDAAIASAIRLRNSVLPELLLIVFVYGIGMPFVWRDQIALHVSSWYATVVDGQMHPSLAGRWLGLVSMPLLQFLVVRWFFRLFIWARFLWQISRIELALEPTHPDGTAGLLFLVLTVRAYFVVLLALGTVLAGMMANRIFYEGANLLAFKLEVVGTVGLLVFVVLGPLLAFTPQLLVARRRGLEEYGALGQKYARDFNRKWTLGDNPTNETLLGSSDIQSLADLRNGHLVIEGIRWTPFNMRSVIALGVITLLPVSPLLLTTFSVEELLNRVLTVLV
jgi:hypothetical protein